MGGSLDPVHDNNWMQKRYYWQIDERESYYVLYYIMFYISLIVLTKAWNLPLTHLKTMSHTFLILKFVQMGLVFNINIPKLVNMYTLPPTHCGDGKLPGFVRAKKICSANYFNNKIQLIRIYAAWNSCPRNVVNGIISIHYTMMIIITRVMIMTQTTQ